MIPLIYVAGPFTAPTQTEVHFNESLALGYGELVAEAGGMPVVPHRSTYNDLQDADFWYAGTANLLRRCDGALFIPGWQDSAGCCGEYKIAQKMKMPLLALDLPPSQDAEALIMAFVPRVKARGGV